MQSRRLLPTLLGALLGGAWGQQALVAKLDGPSFRETFRVEAPVAGGDVIGLMVDPEPLRAGAQKVYVRMPRAGASRICLEATTIDGAYVASNTYLLPKAAPGSYVEVPLGASQPLGTSHPEIFRGASAQSLAMLARTGACADTEFDVLPVAWGTPLPDGTPLRLIFSVQSGRSSASILTTLGTKATMACQPLTSGRRTAFDALCYIDLPANTSTAVQFRLQRCAFDDCSIAPPVRLAL
jgi:hypothetical protein